MFSITALVYCVIGFFIFYNVTNDVQLTIDIKTSSVVKLTVLSILLGVGAMAVWIVLYLDCCDGGKRLFSTTISTTIKQRIINWIER